MGAVLRLDLCPIGSGCRLSPNCSGRYGNRMLRMDNAFHKLPHSLLTLFGSSGLPQARHGRFPNHTESLPNVILRSPVPQDLFAWVFPQVKLYNQKHLITLPQNPCPSDQSPNTKQQGNLQASL